MEKDDKKASQENEKDLGAGVKQQESEQEKLQNDQKLKALLETEEVQRVIDAIRSLELEEEKGKEKAKASQDKGETKQDDKDKGVSDQIHNANKHLADIKGSSDQNKDGGRE